MNKIFLGGLMVMLGSGMAVAQESDTLFPELAGQFEQAPAVEPAEEVGEEIDLTVEQEKGGAPELPIVKPDFNKPAQDPDSNNPTNGKDEKLDTGEKVEGNLVIEIQNVDGVLPYARTLAYCSAEAVLTNETNQRLDQLSLTLTYKDMPKDLNYSNVSKKKKRTQKFMLIGLPCENIKGMPDVQVKTCKLGTQSEAACKKRVQVIPPSG